MADLTAVRWTLAPLSTLYGFIIRCRNFYYSHVPGATRSAGLPVVSVGNLTVGGTGKTPLVIEIARCLVGLGLKPVILTRGYAAAGEVADEVLEFREALPQVPVVVNRDRVAGAATAREQHAADCLVLDDGFQHRRLHRELDIVAVDALEPWGGGRLLPAGRLREPLSSLSRADLFVIARANQADAATLTQIEATLRGYAPASPILPALVQAERLVCTDGREQTPDSLARRRVLAVCAIGNPATFLRLLEQHQAQICASLVFRDHHRYRQADIERIAARAAQCRAELVVTTRKDWVKLLGRWRSCSAGVGLARLDVRFRLAQGTGELESCLKGLFQSRPRQEARAKEAYS